MFQTPILLITFNRPEHTLQVLQEIKKQKPRYLFIFQDAPRIGHPKDSQSCSAVRAILNEPFDWDCKVKTLFPDSNLGCGKGPSSAISWFFEQVEMGIVFEDDCLPHPDFFSYCEQLLLKYKDDERISFIGGSSFQDPKQSIDASYYFGSGSYGTWGWASWSRVWKHFDYYIDTIDKKTMRYLIKRYFKDIRQRDFWIEIYEKVKKDRFNETCWDYQFYFSCWQKGMVAVLPYRNLITNIGYDNEGTHTFSTDHPAANLTTESILPLKFPTVVKLNCKADFYVFRNYTLSYEYGMSGLKRFPYRMNKKLKRLLNHKGPWIRNS